MKLINIQCPNCGGQLAVDSEKHNAVCKFCGTEFLIEESADVKGSAAYYVKNGRTQIDLGRFSDARETFIKMSKEYPADWRAWYGIGLSEWFLNPTPKLKFPPPLFKLLPKDVSGLLGDGAVYDEKVITRDCDAAIMMNRQDAGAIDRELGRMSRDLIEAKREVNKGTARLVIRILLFVLLFAVVIYFHYTGHYMLMWLSVLLAGPVIVARLFTAYKSPYDDEDEYTDVRQTSKELSEKSAWYMIHFANKQENINSLMNKRRELLASADKNRTIDYYRRLLD